MQGNNSVHPFKRAPLDHLARSVAGLLRGLEDATPAYRNWTR